MNFKSNSLLGQSPICSDIDECQLGLAECPPGTKCRNVPGFYQCHENIKMVRSFNIFPL